MFVISSRKYLILPAIKPVSATQEEIENLIGRKTAKQLFTTSRISFFQIKIETK